MVSENPTDILSVVRPGRETRTRSSGSRTLGRSMARAMSTLLESWACQEPENIQRTISIGFEDRVSATIEDFSFAAFVAFLAKDCAVPTC